MNPLVPRPVDLPTPVPLEAGAGLAGLDAAKILAAPAEPGERPAWRAALRRWRSEARARTGYSGELYEDPALAWTRSCFAVCLVWLWDEALYDHRARRFQVERFLAGAGRDFGGFDGVVLWQAYPVIGIDERNQFDYYRQVTALPEVVRQFHDHGVRVFVDYNPWDVGTRRPAGADAEELAGLVAWTGADGVFLDTLREGGPELRRALAGVALEGESSIPLARIADHSLSWAQWCADSATPGVLRAHWFEPRHLMHQTRRWNRDHREELQTAWINGCGMLVWEAVFGSWVGWNPRDRSTLRALLPVQRRFARLLSEGEWTPLDGTDPGPLFRSRFELDGVCLWAAVNRSEEAVSGCLAFAAGTEGRRWFDLFSGSELRPVGDGRELRGEVPGGGVGGVLGVPASMVDEDLLGFLTAQRSLVRTAESSFPERAPVRLGPPAGKVMPAPPPGFEPVAAGRRTLVIQYQVRETGLYGGAPYVEEWKPLPPRLHGFEEIEAELELAAFAIARREVSNAEFAEFLLATGYTPASPGSFLEHWEGGRPPPGRESAPVTRIELDDARAYAAWRGWRLPSEHEWQVAAEAGLLARAEPLVWNWTESEHSDGRTRWAILKGGSGYSAEGSEWYVPGGPRGDRFALKLLLCGEGLARSEWIGFRCAAGLPG